MDFVALLATAAILFGAPSALLSWAIYRENPNGDAHVVPGTTATLALTAATLIIGAPWVFRFVVWAMQITPSP